MKILAFTTSTSRGGAAVLEAGHVLGASRYEDLGGHAERIFSAIDAALGSAGCSRADIAAIACDVGPGSFTGARVGVATAKGIAFALGVPVASVRSLEAMAAAAHALDGSRYDSVFTAIDAKKGEAFVAAYDRDGAEILAPRHVPCDAVAALALGLPGRVAVAGEIAHAMGPIGDRVVRGEGIDGPEAGWVARIAERRNLFADPGALEPVYVRAPDAQPMPSKAPGGC